MYRMCRRFKLDIAHKLDRAFSKQEVDGIHGHCYTIEMVLASQCLNGDMMVVDPGVLDNFIAEVVDEWDRRLFLSHRYLREQPAIPGRVVECEVSPTPEFIATHIYKLLSLCLQQTIDVGGWPINGLRLEAVRVCQGDDLWFEYRNDKELEVAADGGAGTTEAA
jgi:6-pyruvoyl-tetrahydropterin synthase